MKLLDLFAGIGGFSLAAHWMNWETIAFVEKDAFCQKVLRKNFGTDIEIHDDIFTFSGKPFRGTVDIVTGGFPCQPFSQAGKRAGRNDERHLFPEMLRVVREVKPGWVVAENVRGLLSIKSGQVFAEVVASLESEGFEVVTFCIPASAVGAPHRRDRLWIIAHSTSERRGETRSNSERRGETRSNSERSEKRIARSNPALTPNAVNKRRIRRGEQCEVRERESYTRCGNDRSFGESAIDHRGDAADARNTRSSRTRSKPQHESPFEFIAHGNRKENAIDALPDAIQGERIERDGPGPSRLRHRENIGWNENWIEAATRFCRMDDVVSNRVDRLKSLGNAVVPVLVFEIFKAIEQTEKGAK